MSTLKEQAINYLNAVFNEKDLVKVETFWKDDMIQHNPSMPNGLDVLRGFITSEDNQISYEPGIAMEEGNIVAVHGRYSNWFGKTMIAVDYFRVEDGKFIEHWDVMQEEVPASEAVNGNAMFPIK
ncbi:MAG: nuclear transport factor 2 family protein [Veillonella sp.]|uniref:nuclear transport factor 2 family protein n=1 Tax=Veillonella sp. TaxID=1926307 RepID=UPI00116E72BF|nr:nuclear transport factor 2 family protein [Veillonella sp.]MBS7053313.1 nuclear transport factor 2 family protein [Veillonella sp.]VTY17144.1 SnoaL-like domain protein [Streptococcus salivarius]VUW82298.1 SnoaL-like domain protein [Streptococcus thermophilus]